MCFNSPLAAKVVPTAFKVSYVWLFSCVVSIDLSGSTNGALAGPDKPPEDLRNLSRDSAGNIALIR
jgi:hypothetical protein